MTEKILVFDSETERYYRFELDGERITSIRELGKVYSWKWKETRYFEV